MYSNIIIILVSIVSVQAHTFLSNLSINGTRLGLGKCIKPYSISHRNFPVQDPSQSDLTCRTTNMAASATDTCGVQADSTITVEWHRSGDSGDVISASHKGPCLVYLSPMNSDGTGNSWFKIFEYGYSRSENQWCVDKIIKSNGKMDIKIPSDIKPGRYLLRTEIIALHFAKNEYRGPNTNTGGQYFPNCAQLYISGSGQNEPKGVKIPGVYKTDSPGILFDIYHFNGTYPIPGPPVYKPIG